MLYYLGCHHRLGRSVWTISVAQLLCNNVLTSNLMFCSNLIWSPSFECDSV